MELGTGSVRLDASGVSYAPGRMERWRGAQEFSVAYSDIAGLSMTEPHGRMSGVLRLRLATGNDECSLSFRTSQLRAMRRIQREIWQRTKSARNGGATPIA